MRAAHAETERPADPGATPDREQNAPGERTARVIEPTESPGSLGEAPSPERPPEATASAKKTEPPTSIRPDAEVRSSPEVESSPSAPDAQPPQQVGDAANAGDPTPPASVAGSEQGEATQRAETPPAPSVENAQPTPASSEDASRTAPSSLSPKKEAKKAEAPPRRSLVDALSKPLGKDLAELLEKLALRAEGAIGRKTKTASLEKASKKTAKKAPRRAVANKSPPPPIAEGELTELRKRAGKNLVKTTVGDFSFYLPGDLIPGTSPTGGDVGARDDRVHTPRIRFPIESGPAYVNSQVWGWGGTFGLGSSECDLRNYSYPWRDNFCESRSWVSGACPGGIGHQGVDIRAKTCDDDKYWAVAAEAGRITEVGVYGITLRGASGHEYTYLHVNTPKAKVKAGQRVKVGERLALISNHYGGTPTSIHLHFEIRRPSKNGGEPELISPYASLIPAYLRLMAGSEEKAASALQTATVIPRPKQPPRFRGFSGNGPRGWGGGLRDCASCPLMKRVPGGTTKIGSPNNESGRDRNEGPRRTVKVKSFVMGRNEVTRRSWRACVKDGYCRPADKAKTWKSLNHPVTGVTLLDIIGGGNVKKGFIAWMDKQAKRRGRKVRYRLPSEAEWEHALRAGKSDPYSTGQTPDPRRIAFNAAAYKKFPARIRQRKSPVTRRSLRPNRWGMYELAGNVWEFTADCWAKDHRFTPRDGSARGRGCGLATIRGGSVFSPGSDVRSATRKPMSASQSRRDVGFRLVREPIGKAKKSAKRAVKKASRGVRNATSTPAKKAAAKPAAKTRTDANRSSRFRERFGDE